MTDDAKAMNEMMELIRTYQEQHEREVRGKFTKLKTDVVPLLRSLGVATVVLDYSGYGDSTNDEVLSLADADGKPVSKSGLTYDENQMIDLMSAAVPDGYEINEGGYGQVILDVVAGTVRTEHSQRVEQVEYSEEEYEI